MTKSRTRAKADKAEAVGRKNLIINGGFDVWQRGTSFTGVAWAADRWRISTSDSSLTTVKAAGRDTYNTLKITMAGVSCAFDQRIEAFGNVAYNKQFTVSFWVRSNGTFNGNMCRVRNHTTSTDIEDQTYDVTPSWSKVVLTFTANSTWAKDDVCRLYILNNTALASGDWIEFSNVQLELGPVATDFEHRSYGEELALCQRYYEVIKYDGAIGFTSSFFNGSTNCRLQWDYKVRKRTVPTITALIGWSGGTPTITAGEDYASLHRAGIFYIASGSAGQNMLSVDAEL